MKATGIVRRIDDLGRVVIPKEIRRVMRIKEGDPLEIFLDPQTKGVTFIPYSPVRNELDSDTLKSFATSIKKELNLEVLISDCYDVLFHTTKEKPIFAINAKLDYVINNRINIHEVGAEQIAKYELFKEEMHFDNLLVFPIIIEGEVIGSLIILGVGEIDDVAKLTLSIIHKTIQKNFEN